MKEHFVKLLKFNIIEPGGPPQSDLQQSGSLQSDKVQPLSCSINLYSNKIKIYLSWGLAYLNPPFPFWWWQFALICVAWQEPGFVLAIGVPSVKSA